MSALSDKALEIARGELAKGVCGGRAPWARFRGPEVDGYQRAAGLALAPAPSVQGFPWCASGVYWCCDGSAGLLSVPNPCPRTAGAIHMWDAAQDTAGTHTPEPGAVFVLDRGGGKGHVGFVEAVNADGTITTVEPDTSNHDLSATGDAWGRHTWNPTDGQRGTLLGYLVF